MTTPLVGYEGLAKTAAPAAFIPTYTVDGWGEYRDKKDDLGRGREIVSNVECFYSRSNFSVESIE